MSIAEVNDAILSFKRRRDRELKQQLINGFVFAQNTAELIGTYLHKENKARHPWDFFPQMFAEEKKLYEAAQEKQQIETARENRKAYAAEHNRRREAGLI